MTLGTSEHMEVPSHKCRITRVIRIQIDSNAYHTIRTNSESKPTISHKSQASISLPAFTLPIEIGNRLCWCQEGVGVLGCLSSLYPMTPVPAPSHTLSVNRFVQEKSQAEVLEQALLIPVCPLAFRLPGDSCEWGKEKCGVSLNRASLALFKDTLHFSFPH